MGLGNEVRVIIRGKEVGGADQQLGFEPDAARHSGDTATNLPPCPILRIAAMN